MLAIGWCMMAAMLPVLIWFISDCYNDRKKYRGGVRRVIVK